MKTKFTNLKITSLGSLDPVASGGGAISSAILTGSDLLSSLSYSAAMASPGHKYITLSSFAESNLQNLLTYVHWSIRLL